MTISRHLASTAEAEGASWMSAFLVIYMVLLFTCVYLSKLLHDRPHIAAVLPEAGVVILVGMVAGAIFSFSGAGEVGSATSSVMTFSPTVFFIIFLPPIIFNSGYHLHRELFFRYSTPILLFALVGTTISISVVTAILYFVMPMIDVNLNLPELLAFGSLISSTDPVSTLATFTSKQVEPHLFYLLAGESLVNDAVGLVLFDCFADIVEQYNDEESFNLGNYMGHVMSTFLLNFFGSLMLGFVLAIAGAFFFKNTRLPPLLELSATVLLMYAPFCIAELLELSGIVTVLFTAIASRRYLEPNLQQPHLVDTVFRLVAHLTETLAFLDLGMSVMEFTVAGWNGTFVLVTLVAILVGRALNIYPLAFLYNFGLGIRRDVKKWCMHNGGGRKSRRRIHDKSLSEKISTDIEESTDSSEDEDGPGGIYIDDDIHWTASDHDDAARTAVINGPTMHMLCFSGLRGTVSYGLAKMFPDTNGSQATVVVTTMFIVLITTFVLGGTTEVVLKCLRIPTNVDQQEYMKSLRKKKLLKGCLHQLETYNLRRCLIRDFDKHQKLDSDLLDVMAEMDPFQYTHHNDDTERSNNGIKCTIGPSAEA